MAELVRFVAKLQRCGTVRHPDALLVEVRVSGLGYFSVSVDVNLEDGDVEVNQATLLRTARLLMRGDVFIAPSVWPDVNPRPKKGH